MKIRDFLAERIKMHVSTLLNENGARFIVDPIHYLNLTQNSMYDNASMKRVVVSSGKQFLDLEYSEIKRGVDPFGKPAAYFVTEQGFIRYTSDGRNHQLKKVDEVLTSKTLKKL